MHPQTLGPLDSCRIRCSTPRSKRARLVETRDRVLMDVAAGGIRAGGSTAEPRDCPILLLRCWRADRWRRRTGLWIPEGRPPGGVLWHPDPWRQSRRLGVDDLVAGTLLIYLPAHGVEPGHELAELPMEEVLRVEHARLIWIVLHIDATAERQQLLERSTEVIVLGKPVCGWGLVGCPTFLYGQNVCPEDCGIHGEQPWRGARTRYDRIVGRGA